MNKERLLSSNDGSRRILLSLLIAALMVAALFQTLSASPNDQEMLATHEKESGSLVGSAEMNIGDALHSAMEATVSDTVAISSSTATVSSEMPTDVLTSTFYTYYWPLVFKPAPGMTVYLLQGPDSSNNQWTVGFSPESSSVYVTGYEIQEAQNPSFVGATLIPINDPSTDSIVRAKDPSSSNAYYYRARSITANMFGAWSDPIMVAGNYIDDFSNPGSGWRMVRQDTDDVNQRVYYSNGRLIHRQHGRWDYMISSPVKPAPEGAYRMEARARFVGQDNLHTYGLVFGGDWNGSSCPNSKFSSCFRRYYRLQAIWYSDTSGKLRIQLKRIDYHDPDGNEGRGATLIKFKDVNVNSRPSGWQEWRIDVNQSGRIRVYVNGNLIGSATDTRYINNRYFGAYSATNEYGGLQAEFDNFRVTSLN